MPRKRKDAQESEVEGAKPERKARKRRKPAAEPEPAARDDAILTAEPSEPPQAAQAEGEPTAPEPQAAAEPEPGGPEAAEPEVEPTRVHDLLREFAGVLSLFAWQRLGLMMDMHTGKVHRNLSDARVAIDVFGYIVEQISGDLPEEHRRALRSTLADLRINFVEQSKRL
jgi:hypothetical protein